MADSLRFFQEAEKVIYFFLGIGVLIYSIRFWKAWQEMRGSIYGLEQLNAQRRLNQSAVAMFLMLVMAFVVFSLVWFVAPNIAPETVLPLDTRIEGTLVSLPASGGDGTPVPFSGENNNTPPTATLFPTLALEKSGCITGEVEITSPEAGEEVSGTISVLGIVKVEDFGVYIFEIARASDGVFLSIQAGRTLVPEEGPIVESWDTTLFPPDYYIIRLLVTSSDAETIADCRVPIRIGSPP